MADLHGLLITDWGPQSVKLDVNVVEIANCERAVSGGNSGTEVYGFLLCMGIKQIGMCFGKLISIFVFHFTYHMCQPQCLLALFILLFWLNKSLIHIINWYPYYIYILNYSFIPEQPTEKNSYQQPYSINFAPDALEVK